MQAIGEIAQKHYSYKAIKQVPLGTSYKAIKHYSYKESMGAKNAQAIAWKIVEKLNAPSSYQFFLKCAWHLPENTIWSIVERALSNKKVKSPQRWAIAALNQELHK